MSAQAPPLVEAPARRAVRFQLASGGSLLALLYAGALAISAFTILRRIDPFDEGIVLQAARRVSGGQVPYRDFMWAYGPADPYLLGGLFKLFGVSLLDWRILRSFADAAIALEAFVLARRVAGPRLALAAWLTAACAMAQPTSANPYPVALALGLGALVVATGSDVTRRGVLAAALLTALAAAFRLDFGLYALAGTAAALGPRRRTLLYLGAAAALTAAAYAPFLVIAGPHTLYEGVIGRSLREGGYWTLPFPIGYHGPFAAWPPWELAKRAKDVVVFYVPLLLVVGLAMAAAAAAFRLVRARELPAGWAGLLAVGAGCLFYLLSRTDDLHTGPLIVVLGVVLLAVASWLWGHGRAALAIAPAAIVAVLLVYGVSNRLSALLLPPRLERVDVPVADGVEAPPSEARALPRVVRAVQSRVPPGGPIYVAPRRSDLVRFNDPTLYVLTERDNPTKAEFALQTSAAAQARIVAVLRRARPRAIVRWTDPFSSQREPNKRGRPGDSRLLDRYLATDYRLLERDGHYDVLVPR